MEGCTLKNLNSIKFKMADIQQFFTLICVISGEVERERWGFSFWMYDHFCALINLPGNI